MRILMLNYEYPPLGGGAANATKYILKEFEKYDNLQIDLVTSSTDKFRIEKPSKNITIHFLDIEKDKKELHNQSNKDLLSYSYKAHSYSKNLLKKNNYDLIHAFFGIPCGFIAKKLKKPYIVSLRGSDVPFYNEKYKLLDKILFKQLSKSIWRNANFVVANSEGLKDLALKTSPNQKIDIICNGIDTKEFTPKKTYSKSGNIKILCVGRLIARKGFEYVIDAASDMENIDVTFAGDGILKDKLKERAKNNQNIKFLGIVDHKKLAKIYREHDVFILPSFNEGMSNTILEAMASALAIIVTDTGGTKELVKQNGFIIKTANEKQIKDALQKYIKNRDLIELHGKKSREIALEMSWEKVAEKYYKLYKKTRD